MPAEVFVDTSAWYPIARTDHPDHARLADVLTRRVRSGIRVVTTNLVLAESHALLLRRAGRSAALAFLDRARRSPMEVVPSDPELESRAVEEWLRSYADHDLSLTDAVSFAVMTRRGIAEALALDHHFAVAGFGVAG